jgi:MFS family permease
MGGAARFFKTDALAQLAPLRLMFLAVLLFRTGCVLLPFYGLYLNDSVHLRPENVTLVIACFGVGGLLADFTMTSTLSRFSPGRAIQLALMLQAATLILLIFMENPVVLVVGTLAWGFCYEMVNPSCYTLIARTVTADSEKIAFAALRLYINIGMGLGPVIGSVVYALGVPFLLFVLNAVMGLLASVAVHVWSRTYEPEGRPQAAVPNSWRGGWRSELKLLGFLLAAFPSQLAFALPSTVLSLFLVAELHLSSIVAGAVLLVNAVLVVLFEIPLNLATRRWSNAGTIVVGLVCTGLGFAVIGFTTSAFVIIAATVVWTFGEMIVAPAFPSYVREISEPRLLVRNMGVFSGGVNAGLLFAPVAYAASRGVGIPGGVWSLIGALVLISVLVFAVKALRQRRGTVELTSDGVLTSKDGEIVP